MYVDFDYYSNTHGGKVAAEDFQHLEIKASTLVDYYTFNRIKDLDEDARLTVDESIKLAVCELIDYLYETKDTGDKEIQSESVGTYSVTYATIEKNSIEKKKKKILYKYLGFTGLLYRGG